MATEFYRCTSCDWAGFEPIERSSFERYEGAIRELVTVICPNCRAEALDECFPCEECGEQAATVEDWCTECHASLSERGLLIDLGVM